MGKCKFQVRINGGPEQTVKTRSGQYHRVVAALPALLDISEEEFPIRVRIWVSTLLPDYGPYEYALEKSGGPVLHVARNHRDEEIFFTC